MASVNWSELQKTAGSASFDALPVSTYDVEIVKAEAKNAQSSGRLMFVVTFNVINGPHANRKVFNNFVVTPESEAAMGFFFKHMKALGLTSEFWEKNPDSEVVAQQLVGRQATIDVGQRVYQGETRNEVKNVKPYTGASVASAAPAPPPPPANPDAGAPTATPEAAPAGPPKMPF